MAGKILYVCQEIFPYLPESEQSALCRQLVQAMQERGNEIRTFMPRYGCINERRNQLHEVIRLSGMNIAVSLYDDAFPGELDAGFRAKVEHEGVQDENLKILDNSSYQNLMRFVMDYADGIVLASEGVDAALAEYARRSGKPVLEYQAPEAEGFDNYNKFYEEL